MNFEEFNMQMNRLTGRFGEKVYSNDFTKLLWKEISIYPERALEYMVDRAIGELRQAPLLPDFRKWISDYRENMAEFDKKQTVKTFEEAFGSSLTNEETGFLAQNIINSLRTGDKSLLQTNYDFLDARKSRGEK